MPKRLLITTGIFPPDIGGPATQIERLATDLAAVFRVSVLTYGAPERKQRPYRLFSVSKTWPAPLRHFFYGLKTYLLARDSDIIYTTDLYAPGFFSMRAAGFFRKKFVVRFAGDSAWETAFNRGLTQGDILTFQEKQYGSFVEKLKKRRMEILKSADKVIAVSDFMKKLAEKIGVDPAKIKVIYNAVDFFESVPAWKAPETPTLVYSGRLTPWKGVGILVRVVAGLKIKYPDIIFEIIGAGPEKKNLEDLVFKLSLGKNIRFRGLMSEPETHKAFSNSTIFVLNTGYEGLSHAILNAMSVGIPVVTTSAGGNPEIIESGHNGFLVPYSDEKEWAETISKLLDDGNLREKISRNAKKTLEKFKWSELLVKTVEVFNEI